MLQDDAILAVYNCGVHRSVAEDLVLNANDDRLKEALNEPYWALYHYWQESIPFDKRVQHCGTGADLIPALKIFGFREEIINKVQKDRKLGHLDTSGWARHMAVAVYSDATDVA